MEFIRIMINAAQAAGIDVDPALADKLNTHFDLMVAANAEFNLTSITEPEAAAYKHYLDCLYLRADTDKLAAGARVADLGAGAGFPGLIVAALRPDCAVTLIESTNKKCTFLQRAANAMGLDNVTVHNMRAEEAGQDILLRGAFDLVTARALAPLAVLLEYAVPLLCVEGELVAMKGPTYRDELDTAQNALQELKAELSSAEEYSLPDGSRRSLLRCVKLLPTPDRYPRRTGLPAKRPL